MKTRTISLCDGKYKVIIDVERGEPIVNVLRYGEDWAAGYQLKYTNVFVSAIERIVELEDRIKELEGAESDLNVLLQRRSVD